MTFRLDIPKRNLRRSAKKRRRPCRTIAINAGDRTGERRGEFSFDRSTKTCRSVDLSRREKLSSDYTPKTARSMTIRWTEHSIPTTRSSVSRSFSMRKTRGISIRLRCRVEFGSNKFYIGFYNLGPVSSSRGEKKRFESSFSSRRIGAKRIYSSFDRHT